MPETWNEDRRFVIESLRRLDSNAEKIQTILVETKAQSVVLKQIRADTASLKGDVSGQGDQPGLKQRVARIEDGDAARRRFLWLLLGAMVVAGVGFAADKLGPDKAPQNQSAKP